MTMIELNRDQKIKLLALARATIGGYLGREAPSDESVAADFSDPVFQNRCGAFVTLHSRGNLRGCIGYIKGVKPIPDTIIDMAKASAFQDPRFRPLRAEELDAVDIEISVLTPIEPLADVSDIVIGRDGLIISSGARSGLLLPQVASEHNWDVPTFLENTCYKAGLPGDAWKKAGTKIERFSALVFGEKELGLPAR